MTKSELYRIIIRPSAASDLEDISAYIKQHSPQNAPVMIAEIVKAIDSLAFMPNRAKRVGKTRSRGTPVHTLVENPYIIYYSVELEPRVVIVFAIRHGSRRQPRRFS
jgi:plasmid stabilization system protein ParE